MKTSLLIIDDDKEFVSDFMLLLESDYECIHTTDPAKGLEMLNTKSPDVILLDLMLGQGVSGLDILKKIQTIDEDIPVIMITDYGSIDTAVDAIHLGAFDYISKTPNLNELKIIIEKSISRKNLVFKNRSLEIELNRSFDNIIGSSSAIQSVKEKIKLFSQNDNIVLITGESGVGKELVARQIHQKSNRRTKPFIAINCAAIPKELTESELFGHEKGSFTGADKRKLGKFELALDGTIFLDEIAELELSAQVKLLRILQEKEFERVGGTTTIKTAARVIAATNRDLKSLLKEGRFREDLYYRLDVLPILVPPLRDRKDDIPNLTDYFTKKYCIDLKIDEKFFDDDAKKKLMNYNWPGNIRELQNYITRTLLITKGKLITADKIELTKENNNVNEIGFDKIPETWEEMDEMRKDAADRASRTVEKIFLENLLKRFDGNISKAAEHIGINRTNLHRMIKKCNLGE
ncbi:MAG: sigma-54 dependent transcriptional regulator [Melioribacteraceae bacterium]|nr:sigma-54 dependent transcriptional regulator [Melioribacteraceae bacterium]MCF8354267.1 sigma-54 dependent transcriptional regulator [Melioribacteraceae bacterium]MCF8394601.1 sigma-54 dependent transcriptional regulator [Melioribacteraceae bacterium]MCF8419730.1 sigma-54 dependent transcriptional regulator [Melioribacteraceae bacterium]